MFERAGEYVFAPLSQRFSFGDPIQAQLEVTLEKKEKLKAVDN